MLLAVSTLHSLFAAFERWACTIENNEARKHFLCETFILLRVGFAAFVLGYRFFSSDFNRAWQKAAEAREMEWKQKLQRKINGSSCISPTPSPLFPYPFHALLNYPSIYYQCGALRTRFPEREILLITTIGSLSFHAYDIGALYPTVVSPVLEKGKL